MLELFEHLDQQIFLFLNSFHCPFFDPIMYALSGKLIWAPLYFSILLYIALMVRGTKKFFIILLFVILAVLLTDRGSVIIKNLVQRLRPCHEPSLDGLVYIVKGECGGMYSFVSSHAANSFNVALISLTFIRKRWFTIGIVLWAIVVGYTRIYLGVHYPGDVLFGSIYGAFVGWSVYELYVLYDKKRTRKQKLPDLRFFTSRDTKESAKNTK